MVFRSISATAMPLCVMLSVLSLQAQEAKQKVTTSHASGPFEVKLTQQEDKTGPGIGRVILDKKFHGELEATSHGVMIFPTETPKDTADMLRSRSSAEPSPDIPEPSLSNIVAP